MRGLAGPRHSADANVNIAIAMCMHSERLKVHEHVRVCIKSIVNARGRERGESLEKLTTKLANISTGPPPPAYVRTFVSDTDRFGGEPVVAATCCLYAEDERGSM